MYREFYFRKEQETNDIFVLTNTDEIRRLLVHINTDDRRLCDNRILRERGVLDAVQAHASFLLLLGEVHWNE